jgi:hypothetical protein
MECKRSYVGYKLAILVIFIQLWSPSKIEEASKQLRVAQNRASQVKLLVTSNVICIVTAQSKSGMNDGGDVVEAT